MAFTFIELFIIAILAAILGFTLIELLVVIVIIAILAAILLLMPTRVIVHSFHHNNLHLKTLMEWSNA